MDASSVTKTPLRWTPEVKQKYRSPKMTWRSTIEQKLKEINHTWNTIYREEWHAFVAALRCQGF
uniref:Uncharacterized protein n=1 Tax=Arion vulgaris TaxID=1028688 RepID=A0A0B7ARU5_9EUPU